MIWSMKSRYDRSTKCVWPSTAAGTKVQNCTEYWSIPVLQSIGVLQYNYRYWISASYFEYHAVVLEYKYDTPVFQDCVHWIVLAAQI
jgi:hypothetical protein